MRANDTNVDVEVDTLALRAALAGTAAAITEIKHLLRRTWTRPMAVEQRALCALREKATLVCILRAYQRGRHHLSAPMRRGAYPGMKWDPVEYHRRAAEHAAQRFGLRAPATEISP
ncbi:MAG TPA: hypothetical protein VKB80_27415 [Kofleriaceae bacterium]|nr:hypothetical protein [Kofleriaceae bacterium]